MKNFPHLLRISLLLTLISLGARAQTPAGVGIGTTGAPDPSAALEVKSTSQGLLPPRMAQAQRDAIQSPAPGLTIYNTTTNKLNTWNGTSWDASLSATEQPVSVAAQTFSFVAPGGPQTYTVPPGVTSLGVEAVGARGGDAGTNGRFLGGYPARVQTTLPVTPGEVLTIYVGGAGTSDVAQGVGGYNGGGTGWVRYGGGGGGGATDIRRGGTSLTDRIVVAGSGGGAGSYGGFGGNGGLNGTAGFGNNSGRGQGGTQTAGGAGYADSNGSADGSLGQGGNGEYAPGGGGGYYGGGGAYPTPSGGGGGGGSSYVLPAGRSTLYTTRYVTSSPDGSVTLTPGPVYAAPALDGSNFVNVPGTFDNLGNHTATQNLNLAGNQLVGNGTNGLAIDNTGNVGIGTTNPGEKLDIKDGNVQLSATGPASVGIVNGRGSLNLGLAANPGEYSSAAQPGDAVLRTNGQRLLLAGREGGEVLVTTGTGGTDTERLRVTNGGNLGIGTSTPQERLHVAGNVRVDGLAGSGTRMLTTNADGTVGSQPLPGSSTPPQLSLSGSDLSLTNGGTVTLPAQQLSLSGSTLSLSNGGAVTLPASADAQQLSLSGSTLSLTNGGAVTLPAPAPQQLSLSGSTLSLTNGGAVTLPVGLDSQQLSLIGSTLSLTNGGTVSLPVSTDNLGNHTATTNLGLNGNWLSNAPGTANGLRVLDNGSVGIGTPIPTQKLEVAGQVFSSTGGFRFPDNTVQTTAAVMPSGTSFIQNQTSADQTGGFRIGGNGYVGGRLGIGTTNPGHPLTVQADGGSRLLGFNTATGTDKYNFSLTNGGLSLSESGVAGGRLFVQDGGSVGIGTTTPAASALLDVSSTTKGFLPPRLNQTQRDAIQSPAAGLVIFNTNTTRLNVWDGTRWTDAYTSQELAPATGTVFNYTGGVQTYTVPVGVTQLQATVAGAQGGSFTLYSNIGTAGYGATVTTTLAVTPGEVLNLYVGGAGQFVLNNGLQGGGWNGGGNAQNYHGAGGGASDIRRGGTALSNRVVVAGGGGGAQYNRDARGGNGGAPIGADGQNSPGSGATQAAGGASGGSLGQGASGGSYQAGGGGGYYGGGVNANDNSSTSGNGGGGSSWVSPGTTSATSYVGGNRGGNGSISLLPPLTGTTAAISGGNLQLLQLSQPQRDALTSPTAGLLIFNLTTGRLNYYNGTAWVDFLSGATTAAQPGNTETFYNTGAPQTYTVPAGVTAVSVDARGASGGYYQYNGFKVPEGRGARVQATLAVTPGQVLNVFVGGVGQPSLAAGVPQGGYNGGGNSAGTDITRGGAGGGATDIRIGGTGIADRVLVAGGGGGSSIDNGYAASNNGGNGGAPDNGNGGAPGGRVGGLGGTQTTGGAGGQGASANPSRAQAGAGGGGYFGGLTDDVNLGGGGGGSSYVRPTGSSNVQYSGLPTTGDGSLAITPIGTLPAPALDGSNISGTWQVSGADVYRASGNVGIGTSTPGQKLDVTGNTNVSGSSYVGGRVGIGTTGPATTLDVRTTDATAAITVGSTGDGAGALYFGNPNHGLKRNYGGGNDVGLFTTSGSVYLSAAGNTSTSQFVLQSGGNVGIGNPNPGQKLDVTGNANVSGSSYVGGRVGIGTTNLSARLTVQPATDADQGLRVTDGSNGNLVLQTLTGGNSGYSFLGFNGGYNNGEVRYNTSKNRWRLGTDQRGSTDAFFFETYNGSTGTTIFTALPNGNLGIGTGSPIAPLHVKGAATTTVASGNSAFFNQGGGFNAINNQSGNKQTTAYFEGGEVWVAGYVIAGNLQTTSDRRIKHVIGLSDRATDLSLLNRLRITNYTYIDQVNNTPGVVKKVIAQEVEEVLPTAVTRSRQALPNVYERATKVSYANGQLTVTTAKPHELPATGGRMRFYTPANESLDPEVTVVDAHTVRFASPDAHAAGLFMYGKYVDDFRSVDYDALTTLNVSATQELARKVAALEAESAALQARATSAEAQAARATATLEAFETRLRALEAAGEGQARR